MARPEGGAPPFAEQAARDPRAVRGMFARIAPAYDRANAVLSLGVHGRWRRRAVRLSGARPGDRVLDLATGTGDLALEFARAVGPDGRVVGADFVAEMVRLARGKAAGAAEVAVADALALPFRDASFDVASIAFGIRNVADPSRCLREMSRVLAPGGRAVVLEFGQPAGIVGPPFAFYSRHVIPRVGGWISGDRAAYEYLPRTSAEFPAGARFVALAREIPGLAEWTATPLTGGIAWVYVGRRRA